MPSDGARNDASSKSSVFTICTALPASSFWNGFLAFAIRRGAGWSCAVEVSHLSISSKMSSRSSSASSSYVRFFEFESNTAAHMKLSWVDAIVACDADRSATTRSSAPSALCKTLGADELGIVCIAQPPVLCSPQNGISSRELPWPVKPRRGVVDAGAELGCTNSACFTVLQVLYPSGTDFLTRMPTLMRPACVSSGSGGDNDNDGPCELNPSQLRSK